VIEDDHAKWVTLIWEPKMNRAGDCRPDSLLLSKLRRATPAR
jgi:hypothetical protein